MVSAIENLKRHAAKSFLDFVNSTGSPYHTVLAARRLLDSSGFVRLDDYAGWPNLPRGGKYYVTKNHSTIMAFVIGKKFDVGKGGFIIAGSHTDSPCLRIRPNSDITSEGYRLLGVETYGGGLWHTWFDRGLGLCGKIVIRTEQGTLEEKLIRIPRPLVIIPNLAIHLQNAEERAAFKINTENHVRPVLCSEIMRKLLNSVPSAEENKKQPELIRTILAEETGCTPEAIIDLDVCLMDATEGRFVGYYNEFIESARIDNLASAWAGISSISELSDDVISRSSDIMVAVSWDHEEIGSESFVGANSSTLDRWIHQVLTGILSRDDSETFANVIARSFLLSTDGAHAVHPSYADKHQALHKPLLNNGVVIKENCNQRYSSSSSTMALLRSVASRAESAHPLQNIVVRNDSPCGSTIGPVCTARLAVRGVDVGIAQWAMHSCRETCGADDLFHLKNLISTLFAEFRDVDNAVVHL